MRPARPLTLYEEILLLALDDDKGTTGLDSRHDMAMGGAALAELVLLGAVTIDADRKKLVTAAPGVRVADPLLAECLELVRGARRRRRAGQWVQKFAGLKGLKNRVARGLVEKGVLREGRDKVLGLFPRTIFPERDGGPEHDLIARLEHAVFAASPRVDERTLVVAVLADATGLLPRVFDKKKLKGRKQRLKKLADGQPAGAATREAVEAAQAAAAVLVIVAGSMAATTTTTS